MLATLLPSLVTNDMLSDRPQKATYSTFSEPVALGGGRIDDQPGDGSVYSAGPGRPLLHSCGLSPQL